MTFLDCICSTLLLSQFKKQFLDWKMNSEAAVGVQKMKMGTVVSMGEEILP